MPNPFEEAHTWHITAGPGCGKTHFLQETIEGLLSDGVEPLEIAYVLFNRKPAEAFRSRFTKRFLPEDMRWWGTHHAMCYRLMGLSSSGILSLPEWGKEHGFDLSHELEMKERGVDDNSWDAVFLALSKKIYMGLRNFNKTEERLLQALKKTEDEEGKFCHVRYLEKAINLDLFPAGVRYVFVDEAQDNGKLQFDWLERLIKKGNLGGLMMAGDDKQAINRFKGGASNLFLNFKAEKYMNLETTFRLPPKILEEANRVISPVRFRSGLTSKTTKTYPGKVVWLSDLRDALGDISVALKHEKNVMVLARNRCWLGYVRNILKENSIPCENEWTRVVKRILSALMLIRKQHGVTEETLAAILPSRHRNVSGEFRQGVFWDKDAITRLRSGKILEDKIMFAAYEIIRLGGVLPLERLGDLGFRKVFEDCVKAWDFPDYSWNLPSEDLYAFKKYVQYFGINFRTVRVDTIHAVKGEEADVVVLLKNITAKTEVGEFEEEDEERRVWFVGESRAKEMLILTSLSFMDKHTQIL